MRVTDSCRRPMRRTSNHKHTYFVSILRSMCAPSAIAVLTLAKAAGGLLFSSQFPLRGRRTARPLLLIDRVMTPSTASPTRRLHSSAISSCACAGPASQHGPPLLPALAAESKPFSSSTSTSRSRWTSLIRRSSAPSLASTSSTGTASVAPSHQAGARWHGDIRPHGPAPISPLRERRMG